MYDFFRAEHVCKSPWLSMGTLQKNEHIPPREKENIYKSIFKREYCWWKKSCTWDVQNSQIMGYSPYQLVQDFFHQQYVGSQEGIFRENVWKSSTYQWPTDIRSDFLYGILTFATHPQAY